MALSFFAHGVYAAGTSADTDIVNTARVDYKVGDEDFSDEDSASITVAQVLDLTVTCQSTPLNVAPGQSSVSSTYLVVNTGNGPDTIELSVDNSDTASDDFNPVFQEVWLDDGDGIYQGSGTDTLYQAGVNDPELAADGQITVFVLNDIPAGLSDGDDGDSELTATSTLQSSPLDPVGTVYDGQGLNSVDAIVGNTQASAADICRHTVLAVVVTLAKTNEILPAFNTDTVLPGEVLSEPIPGAVITYTLTVSADGDGTATDIVITDTVPEYTTYASGNFTLNSGALTEASDTDAGEIVGGDLSVIIPAMSGGDSHTVTFNVTID